jgi:hypothetical protein
MLTVVIPEVAVIVQLQGLGVIEEVVEKLEEKETFPYRLRDDFFPPPNIPSTWFSKTCWASISPSAPRFL